MSRDVAWYVAPGDRFGGTAVRHQMATPKSPVDVPVEPGKVHGGMSESYTAKRLLIAMLFKKAC